MKRNERGQLPKAYLRMDPNIDQHADCEGMVMLMCAANRQPIRGRFQPEFVVRLLGKRRAQQFMTARPGKRRPDLAQLDDGTLYLDGWEEWQEGDLTVGERVRRLRAKRYSTVTAPVTQPLPGRDSPSEALGVKASRRLGNSSIQEEQRAGVVASPADAGSETPVKRAETTPPAPGFPGVIPHDPADPLHVRLVVRIEQLVHLVTANGAGAESDPDELARETLRVLQSVTSTPAGKSIDDLRKASAEWIEQSLRACDQFEADNT